MKHSLIPGLVAGALLMPSFGVTDELPGYSASRLSIAVARQWIDDDGHQNIVLPSNINEDGIMGGRKMRWQLDPVRGSGVVVGMTGESSYLFDVTTKSFIAETIDGHAITHVGDDNYIAKRLDPTGFWETLRCEINGVVQRIGSDIHDNPSCVVIDRDELDLTPHGGSLNPVHFWSDLYTSTNMASVGMMGQMATNRHSSSVVLHTPDDLFIGSMPTWNLYLGDGFAQPLTSGFGSLHGFPMTLINEFSIFSVVGVTGGQDAAWGVSKGSTSPSTPDVVHQLVYLGSGAFQGSNTSITAQDGLGNYARALGITKEGRVYTNLGSCEVAVGCSSLSSYTSPLVMSDPLRSPYLLNNGLWLGAVTDDMTAQVGILDLRTATPGKLDVANVIEEEFGDKLGVTLGYVFPADPPAFNAVQMRIGVTASESGKYLVFSGRDELGNYHAYLFEEE